MNNSSYKVTSIKSVFNPYFHHEIDLDLMINDIKNGTYSTMITALRALTDKEEYKTAKKKLPAYALNGTFNNSVKNSEFSYSSGLYNIDIDNLSGNIDNHKSLIVAAVPSVVYIFNSPSNQGVKIGISIDPDCIKNDEDFKQYFPQFEDAFKAAGYEIDASCKDISRKCFTSYDPDIYVNLDAPVFELIPPALKEEKTKDNHSSITTPQFTLISNSPEECIGKSVNTLLKKALDGNRHKNRYDAGRLAGGYIAGGLVSEDLIFNALLTASDQVASGGITNESERKTILDGIANGKQHPLNSVTPLIPEGELFQSVSIPKVSYTTQDVRDGTPTSNPFTELGNAKRLRDSCRQNSKFIIGLKEFIHWEDNRWRMDFDGAIMKSHAAKLPKQIYNEGQAYLDQSAKFSAWSRASQFKKVIENAVGLYTNFQDVRVLPSELDANLYAIGIDGAREMVDLTTGIKRATTQKDLITKTTNVHTLGTADQATRWLQFLNEVFGFDKELIDWVQRWCGYLLSGSTQEQVFVFCYGSGSNGKSVFIEMLKFILGDYAKAIQPEMLSNQQKSPGAATPELAALKGIRLALGTETEEGVHLAESLIKVLTGGDTIVARPLYGSLIEYLPQFKIMLTGNHKPIIKGNDEGIWRRIKLLHFTQKFEKGNCDPNLLLKLKAESPHILAWLVDGCLAWQKQGLNNIPRSIEAATNEYRTDQDIVGKWLTEYCSLTPLAETKSTILYKSYKTWCEENGMRPSSSVILSRRLEDRGLEKTHTRNGRIYKGISVDTPHFLKPYIK